jgi:protein Mpv17
MTNLQTFSVVTSVVVDVVYLSQVGRHTIVALMNIRFLLKLLHPFVVGFWVIVLPKQSLRRTIPSIFVDRLLCQHLDFSSMGPLDMSFMVRGCFNHAGNTFCMLAVLRRILHSILSFPLYNYENVDNLDQLIVGIGPKEVISKICIDQLLWCPMFMVCYFSYLGIASGESVSMVFDKIQDDLFTAVTASWKIWPLAHAVQFRWVATKHRIIYINCIEVCFIMFLSFLANQ